MPVPKLSHSFSFGKPICVKKEESEEESYYSEESDEENPRMSSSRQNDEKIKAKGHWTAEEDSLL